MRRHVMGLLAVALSVALPLQLIGQQTPPASANVGAAPDPNVPISFEVASIKPNTSSGQGQNIRRQAGGRLTVEGIPARMLITFAYQIQSYQLIGGPGWISRDRFDIVAKLDGDPPSVAPGLGPDHMMLALRTLLADRFKLVVHRETRELDIYALMMASPGGKPGPQLKVAGPDCSPESLAARRGAAPNALPPIFCGTRTAGPGRLMFSGMPLAFYATFVSGQVGRFVVDRTGLTGNWDFTLTYAPTGPVPTGADPPPVDPNAADLFTALREQLGLKLESTKGPVDVMVIDSIQQPIPD